MVSIATTMGDDQAKEEPPPEIGTNMKTVAMRLVKAPRKSTFRSFFLKDPVTGLRGRKNMMRSSDETLNGTVIQKTHRHFKLAIQIERSYGDLLGKNTSEERTGSTAHGNSNSNICLILHQHGES